VGKVRDINPLSTLNYSQQLMQWRTTNRRQGLPTRLCTTTYDWKPVLLFTVLSSCCHIICYYIGVTDTSANIHTHAMTTMDITSRKRAHYSFHTAPGLSPLHIEGLWTTPVYGHQSHSN